MQPYYYAQPFIDVVHIILEGIFRTLQAFQSGKGVKFYKDFTYIWLWFYYSLNLIVFLF